MLCFRSLQREAFSRMDVISLTQMRYLISPMDSISSTQFRPISTFDVSTRVTADLQRQPALTHHPFDEMPERDSYAWNGVLREHLKNGQWHCVCSSYREMVASGVRPDKHTLPRVVDASRLLGDFLFGRQVHGHAVKFGFADDQYVITALMQMYGRLGCVDAARWMLMKSSSGDNSVPWTMLAKMYILENKPSLALEAFKQMVGLGVKVDSVSLATALAACGMLRSVHEGKKMHKIARKCNLESDVLVSNSLLKMYMECGRLKDARAVFDTLLEKDVISWTEVIRGHVKNGEFNEGFKLFRQMNVQRIKPDSVSIASVLPACARPSAHMNGKEIHGYLFRNGISMNVTVLNAVMDMYVKTGYIKSASKIFESMQNKDAVSWTVMILGFSLHGQGDRGVMLFRELERTGIHIDNVLYAAVLHACCTSRMVEVGKQYFRRIMAPSITHCALLVSLLTRSGLDNEAKLFINEKKLERQPEVVRALLDGCRIHQHAQEGMRLAETLCEIEPLNPDNYILVANWYASQSKPEMAKRTRETIRDMGLRTKKAYSWIVLQSKVHVFGTADQYHPRLAEIYSELQQLRNKMENEGCTPTFDYTLHDVDQEQECDQFEHSELLAISLGLISTQEGADIHVTKNLRVCRNCHETAKFLSKTVGREIILKDPNCFHHFYDGFCSCGDFW